MNFKPSQKRFRAWDNANKKFPFIGFDILGETTVFDLCKQYELKYALDLEITQFTGLLDSQGNEIYEGDILKILYSDWISKSDSDKRTLDQYLEDIAHAGVVEMQNGAFKLNVNSFYLEIVIERHGFVKVIGNIYETPKLLE